MGATVFLHPAFVWACAMLAGGCLTTALVLWQRKFLLGLSERFVRLPPANKAVFVAAVAVATAVAQKLGTREVEVEGGGGEWTEGKVEVKVKGGEWTEEVEVKVKGGEWTSTSSVSSQSTNECLSNLSPPQAFTSTFLSSCQSVVKTIRADSCQFVANKIVSSNDVVRGYRLETVRTNEVVSYSHPANARLVGTWHLTDAYKAVARVVLTGEVEARGGGGEWTEEVEVEVKGGEWTSSFSLPSTNERLSNRSSPSISTSTFLFPIGSHVVTSLWAHVWGKARPQLRNASNEIAAVDAPMFARRGQSFLWSAATTNGSVLVTWENFFLGNPYEKSLTTDLHGSTRIGEGPAAPNAENEEKGSRGGGEEVSDRIVVAEEELSTDYTDYHGSGRKVEARGGGGEWTSSSPLPSISECLSNLSPPQASTSTSSLTPISAQLELFPNGDFIARSNAVERVYRRVNPDDWDDDGIPNADDDAPLVAADEPQFGPRQTLPEGANSNAYCWVDLVVRQTNAKVTFAGDGASALTDPSFVAKADTTNRVTLLIGKTYRVTCPMPFALVGKSSEAIEESWERDDAALWLRWPVSISSESEEESSTDDHGLARIAAREELSTDYTDYHGLGEKEESSTNQHESARISIRVNLCQSVDKNIRDDSCQFVANSFSPSKPSKLFKPSEYAPTIEVIAPQAIEPRNVGYWKANLPTGSAGSVGLEFDLYVLPLDVSFSGLAAEEVPCDVGSRSGYFLNSHFTNLLSHTSDNGAGNWLLLSPDHLFGVDAPGVYSALPRMTPDGIVTNDESFGWTYGTLTWQIPFGWNEGVTNRTAPIRGRFAEDTVHENVIFESGKVGVRKLRQAVTREADGIIYLNGVRME